ncbi:hypothetical protein RIF29_04427 [Crotalaria pallida]|uniref:BOS complex subunit TMEM147 n=1 Tax=Crotalaria pallida TaxID=3830 RepID=A0AAN9J1R9_CROPI
MYFLEVVFSFLDRRLVFLVLLRYSDLHLGLGDTSLVASLAFSDFVLHRLAPLWVGARGLEFTWDYILQSLEANANLISGSHPAHMLFWYTLFLCFVYF